MERMQRVAHTAVMDTDDPDDLYDLAVEMALEAFDEAVGEHVDAILERLQFNERYGLGLAGTTTVH